MDSKQAAAYVTDPLYAPQAHEETGLNAHFRSTFQNPSSEDVPRETNPFRKSSAGSPKDQAAVKARPASSHAGYPTPPPSASPQRSSFGQSYRQDAFGSGGNAGAGAGGTRARRSSSLTQRYPGDHTHQPLEMLRRDSKKAHRAPHLRKRHIPGADTIDRLDQVNGAYHHEGPYDAALLARNTSYESSPIAAVQDSTEEAIRATPREKIIDAVKGHRPLDGVALIPPGGTDRFGTRYDYNEGENMIADGADYKRWPGHDHYYPNDVGAKGDSDEDGIEMRPTNRRNRSSTLDHHVDRETLAGLNDGAAGAGPRRTASHGKQVGEGLKRRLGSLRRRKA